MEKSSLKSATSAALSIFSGVFLVVVTGAALTLGHWALLPYHPIEINSLSVIPLRVSIDDQILMAMDYCKHTDDVADVELYFINDVAIPLTMTSPEPLKTGCDVLKENVTIHGVPPGKYKMGMVRTYHPNPITWLKVRKLSNEFEVLAPPEKATVSPAELKDATRQAAQLGRKDYAKELAANHALVKANQELIRSNALLLQRVDELVRITPKPKKK